MTIAANIGYLSTLADLEKLAGKVIRDGRPIAIDVETGYEGESRSYKNTSPSLHPEENILAGYSFTNDQGWARYAPLHHDDGPNLDPRGALRGLWDMCATGLAVCHNADMEERTLSRNFMRYLADDRERGAAVRASKGYFPIRSDTMMECHALAQWESLKLKELSRVVLHHDQAELISLFPGLPAARKYTLRFTTLDPTSPAVYSYACDDVIRTWQLHVRHYDAVLQSAQAGIYKIEMAVLPVIWAMEDEALAVDWDMLDAAAARARVFLGRMKSQIDAVLSDRLGRAIKLNLGSPKQLREVLYGAPPMGLGLRQHHMTKGGKDGANRQPSTDALALKSLASDMAVRQILDWRGLDKLRGTYLEPFRKEYGWCECGRAHCHLLPHGTVTGRFSSADFNYQNLPKKVRFKVGDDEFVFKFRDAIVAPSGWYGMGFDLSQAELRVVAGEAGETALIEAFERGEDVHAFTASLMLGITIEEVYQGGELFGRPLDEFRSLGKTLNFALIYQLSVRGLADRLGIPVEQAQELYDRYFSIFSRIAAYTRRVVADSHVNGYTTSSLGRRHPIWAYSSDKNSVIAGGERTAGNAPVQGGVADLMKIIMVRCDKLLRDAGLIEDVRMVMNIHDALEFYVRETIPPQRVVDVLTPAIMFKLPQTRHWPPMKADWHAWLRWGSAFELKLDETGRIIGRGGEVVVAEEVAEDDPDVAWDSAQDDAGPAVLAAPAQESSGDPAPGDSGLSPASGNGRDHQGVVVVKVTQMPELAAVHRLVAMLGEYPGPNPTLLETPMGRAQVCSGTALTPEDAPRFTLMLPGARVLWDAGSVPLDRVTSGVSL